MAMCALVSSTMEKGMGKILERILPHEERIRMPWVLKDKLKHKFSPELWAICCSLYFRPW